LLVRKPLRFLIGVLIVVVPVLWITWSWRRPAVVSNLPDDSRLTFDTPYRNVRPEVKYVGDEACTACHLTIAESYRRHSMGRSLVPMAQQAAHERYGKQAGNPFQQWGFEFQVQQRDGRVFHHYQCRDPQGKAVCAAEEEVRFVVGSGSRGRSYLVSRDGFVFQSPISWFSQQETWDLSPGFKRERNFERAVRAECLFCHCNQVVPRENTDNGFEEPLFRGYAIGCERCHGPGQLHVEGRERGDPVEGVDYSIVNPSRLEPRLRDAVCEQCHLQGEARIVRRGRQVFDYRPGLPLHLFWSVFVRKPEYTDNNKAVSQVQQMHDSQCYRGSKGKLGCISCHDPHQLPPPAQHVSYYRERCLQCHADEKPCSLAVSVRRQRQPDDSCVACHMPHAPSSNIAHTAITDHRILRRAEESKPAAEMPPLFLPGEVPMVHFHRDLVDPKDPDVGRDLGLALVGVGQATPVLGRPFARTILSLLDASLKEHPNDVAALEGRGYALWLQGRAHEAQPVFEEVVTRAPQWETALAHLATLTAQLNQREAAIGYWQRTIAVNPWKSGYHRDLAQVLADNQEWSKAAAECQKALRLSPADLETRVLLIGCFIRNGQKDRAREELEKVVVLDPAAAETYRRQFAEQIR
jgi:predicted CXXCH cytochrome family protein